MPTYTIIPFYKPYDDILHKYSRRCYRPRYGDISSIAPMTSIPVIIYNEPPRVPINTRFVSPLSQSYRAPNLSEFEWSYAERTLCNIWTRPGIIIQIFSTITAINIKSIYLIERTTHPFRQLKRTILSYHLSEKRLLAPHVVNEIDIE
jgi:hypothetical protein